MPTILSALSSRAIIGKYYASLEKIRGSGWAGRWSMKFGSDQLSETYKWLGMAPKLRVWDGERLIKKLRAAGMTITNQKYESTLGIAIDDHRRDKTGQLDIRIGEHAKQTERHVEALLTDLLLNGESGLAYDGQAYFSAAHRYIDANDAGGAQKNLLTSSEVPTLNVVDPTAPTEAEFAAAILNVASYMMGYKDDQGEPVNGDAMSFEVMVPVVLFPVAASAVRKEFLTGASGSVVGNPLKAINELKINVVANPRLTWTSDWVMSITDGVKPLIEQEESPVQVDVLGEGSDHAFKADEYLYGVKVTRAVGYGLWSAMAKAKFS